MRWYSFINKHGEYAAINMDEVGDMHQKGDDVYARWGGTSMETTMIPNTRVEDILTFLGEIL